MSEAQNTVEETPVVAPTTEVAPAADATATEAPAATETVGAPAEAPVEAPKEEAAKDKKEITPATDGILGYKGPGLVKSLRFIKRYFYFSDDAVEAKHLVAFNANEKDKSAAHATSAWATQTGKGLLFFTKRAEDKLTPAGIFNLSEITDLTKESINEFHFKLHGHKHAFQATSSAERNSWFAAIEANTNVAKAEKETVTSSEGYKSEVEKLKKYTVPVAPSPAAKKAKEITAKDDKKEDKEDKKDETAPPADDAKNRSRSRKRASFLGSFIGKKDAEVKEGTSAEATTETPAPATEAAEPGATEATTEAATSTAEAPATTQATEDKKEEDVKKPEAAKSKRASIPIFSSLFQKAASPQEKETTTKETAVSSTAPQLENPVEEAATEPIQAEAVTAAADTAAGETPKETTETAATPSSKPRGLFSKKEKKEEDAAAPTETANKDKRRSSLFPLGGNKIGGLFRKPSKAVKVEEKKEGAAAAADADAEDDKPEPISKDEPAPAEDAAPAVNGETEATKDAVTTSTPVVEATA